MSLALATSSKTPAQEPATHLQDALLEFQSILSDAEKEQLKDLKEVPDEASVLTFTASLDRMNPKQRGRSVATRFYSFLLSIQQYTRIVDVYVSSNPTVAALIWGSVQFTMMFMTNFASYFQDLSKLFLDFEHWCPQYEQYRLLYPSSQRLQESLSKFYASIVRCCRDIIVVTRRSWSEQMLHALSGSFSAEVIAILGPAKATANEVDREIMVAKAQTDKEEQNEQALERKAAAQHRHAWAPFFSKAGRELDCASDERKQLVQRREVKRKKKLLDELSDYDYFTAFNVARGKRYQGTCDWLTLTEPFEQWRDSPGTAISCLCGNFGCGKTIMCATLLDHLFARRSGTQRVILFFPTAARPASLHAETILRSLIRQCVHADALSESIERQIADAKDDFWSPESLGRVLNAVFSELGRVYIVIDGLDELEAAECRTLLRCLKLVASGQSLTMKLLLASRPSLQSELRRAFPDYVTLRIDDSSTRPDLEHFTKEIVHEKHRSGDLVVADVSLLDDIVTALTRGAQGMFLWVALEIEEICAQICDKDIRIALGSLPGSLGEIFVRALQRIKKHKRDKVCRAAFTWVIGARRPMSLSELQEAIPLEVGQTSSQPDSIISGIERLPEWSQNLLEVEELSRTVQFVHHSVKQFLTEKEFIDQAQDFHIGAEVAHDQLGTLCMTYLAFNDFKTAVTHHKISPAHDLGNTRALVTAALGNAMDLKMAERLSTVAARFTRRRDARAPPLSMNFPQKLNEAERDLMDAHPLLGYAADYWLDHTSSLGQFGWELAIWELCLTGAHSQAKAPWPFPSEMTRPPYAAAYLRDLEHVFEWATSHRHYRLAGDLISPYVAMVKQSNFPYSNTASMADSWAIAKLARLEDATLLEAYSNATQVSPTMLTESGIGLFFTAYFSMNMAFEEFAYEDYREVFEQLLLRVNEHTDRVTIQSDVEQLRQIVFAMALLAGSIPAVQAMLAKDSTLPSRELPGLLVSPLQLVCDTSTRIAREQHHISRKMVSLLLDFGADPNEAFRRKPRSTIKGALSPPWDDKDQQFQMCPLAWAYEEGDVALRFVSLFLEKGADPWVHDRLGRPVAKAIQRLDTVADFSVAHDLLCAGLEQPAVTESGEPLLHAIVKSTRFASELALRLLKMVKAESPEPINRAGQTAIHVAAHSRRHELIPELLKKGCNPGAIDSDGNTAFHIAASALHLQVIEVLLFEDTMNAWNFRNSANQTAAMVLLESAIREASGMARNSNLFLRRIAPLLEKLLRDGPLIRVTLQKKNGDRQKLASLGEEQLLKCCRSYQGDDDIFITSEGHSQELHKVKKIARAEPSRSVPSIPIRPRRRV